jgi:hypothetical protein
MNVLNATVGIFGLVALIASVWFVRRQADKAQAALRLTAANSTDSAWVALSEAYFAYPTLRSYFYEDEMTPPPLADLTQENQLRLNAMAELLLDAADVEIRFQNDQVLLKDKLASSYWETYLRDAFGLSRFLTDYCLRRKNWYHPTLVRLAEAAIANRKAAEGIGGRYLLCREADLWHGEANRARDRIDDRTPGSAEAAKEQAWYEYCSGKLEGATSELAGTALTTADSKDSRP